VIELIALRERCCGFHVGRVIEKGGQRTVRCAFCREFNGWNASKSGRIQQVWQMYRLFGHNQVLLYIGMTGNFSNRLREHYKDKEWAHEIRQVLLSDPYPSREAVLKAEREAIENERPKHNVMHNERNDRWN